MRGRRPLPPVGDAPPPVIRSTDRPTSVVSVRVDSVLVPSDEEKAMCVRAALARLVIAVCGVIVYGVVSGTADAQPVSGGLKHLSEVRLAVEDVDEEAQVCGITSEILNTAVRGPLLNSRLRVMPQARDYVYVAIAAIRPRGVCAANVTFEVNRWSSDSTTLSRCGGAAW
jgi:hypothetical protein